MDNQHRRIPDYRELSQGEIEMISMIKNHGKVIEELVDILRDDEDIDQRWVSIGATHLQQGLMALTRAVAKPDFS